MSLRNNQLRLPSYDHFIQSISVLDLHVSGSELHGIMCGFLCANADEQGESYLRALVKNKKDEASRAALLALFDVFSISQQQILNFDFEFELLFPDDDESLVDRARAFKEWCAGFVKGLDYSAVGLNQIYEEDAQEALEHIIEFSELDCDSLEIGEEDEKALMEVAEYTRMAVIRLYGDLVMHDKERDGSGVTH